MNVDFLIELYEVESQYYGIHVYDSVINKLRIIQTKILRDKLCYDEYLIQQYNERIPSTVATSRRY